MTKLQAYLNLIKAGYSKAEISEIMASADDPAPAAAEPAAADPEPAADPAPAAAEPAEDTGDPISALTATVEALAGTVKAMQALNINASKQPEKTETPKDAAQILAETFI